MIISEVIWFIKKRANRWNGAYMVCINLNKINHHVGLEINSQQAVFPQNIFIVANAFSSHCSFGAKLLGGKKKWLVEIT